MSFWFCSSTAFLTPPGGTAVSSLSPGSRRRSGGGEGIGFCAEIALARSSKGAAPPMNMSPSPFAAWFNFTIPNALHLLGIFTLALLLNRLLRRMTNSLIQPAGSQTRAAQTREQQTRTLASALYSAGSKIVWGVAVLTALPEFG